MRKRPAIMVPTRRAPRSSHNQSVFRPKIRRIADVSRGNSSLPEAIKEVFESSDMALALAAVLGRSSVESGNVLESMRQPVTRNGHTSHGVPSLRDQNILESKILEP